MHGPIHTKNNIKKIITVNILASTLMLGYSYSYRSWCEQALTLHKVKYVNITLGIIN